MKQTDVGPVPATQPPASLPTPVEPSPEVITRGSVLMIPGVPAPVSSPPLPSEESVRIVGLLEPVADAEPLPADPVSLPSLDHAAVPVEVSLLGTWRQIGGPTSPDHFEGNHLYEILTFRADGSVVSRRVFDPDAGFEVVRSTGFRVISDRELVIGQDDPIDPEALYRKDIRIPIGSGKSIEVKAPALPTPRNALPMSIQTDRLTLAERIFERVAATASPE